MFGGDGAFHDRNRIRERSCPVPDKPACSRADLKRQRCVQGGEVRERGHGYQARASDQRILEDSAAANGR